MSLYPSYNSPGRGRKIGAAAGALDRNLLQRQLDALKEREEMKLGVETRGQDITADIAKSGQAITSKGQELAAETSRYGTDVGYKGQQLASEGALERTKLTEAGALGRTNITEAGATERTGMTEAGSTARNTATVAADRYRTDVIAPYYKGEGSAASALADQRKFNLGVHEEIRPDVIAAQKADMTSGITKANVTSDMYKQMTPEQLGFGVKTPTVGPKLALPAWYQEGVATKKKPGAFTTPEEEELAGGVYPFFPGGAYNPVNYPTQSLFKLLR